MRPLAGFALHLELASVGLDNMFVHFKHLRKTKHTHNPADDARGNAEALLQIKETFGLRISFK